MALQLIQKFLKQESTSAYLLLLAALVALFFDNSPFSSWYQAIFTSPLQIQLGSLEISKPFLFWINEGLMTLFFLVVGFELKRELLAGELKLSKIALPAIAALGGMIVPAFIYILINYSMTSVKGWPIPVATDIAFALGVLSLFGKRVPLSLKIFLLALAIFDDIGAIVIIALFHTKQLSFLSLMLALGAVMILFIFRYAKIKTPAPYFLVGFLLWIFVLKSGVHATLSGVILAFIMPEQKKLTPILHNWVAYLVMPLFALANAGVSFKGFQFSFLMKPVTLGIILGLFFGKQIGVMLSTWLAIKLQPSVKPENANWLEIYGVALLCGIGFTMSLFLGTLAFEHDPPIYLTQVRMGVLFGSVLSGAAGAMIFYAALPKKPKGGRKIGAE